MGVLKTASRPEEPADAYRTIVGSAYLTAYRNTLRLLLVAIGVMILVALLIRPTQMESHGVAG